MGAEREQTAGTTAPEVVRELATAERCVPLPEAAAGVLALQRSAGNQAVNRLIAGGAPAALMRGSRSALARRVLARLVDTSSGEYVRGRNDGRAGRDKASGPLSDVGLENYDAGYALGKSESDHAQASLPPVSAAPAAAPSSPAPAPDPAAAERARIAQLDTDTNAALAAARVSGNWLDFARFTCRWNETDRRDRLNRLTLPEVEAVVALTHGPNAAELGNIAVIAEQLRIAKHLAAFRAAIGLDGATANWREAARLAGAFSEADMLPKLRLIPATHVGDFATAAAAEYASDNNLVRRTIAFLQVESLTGAAVRPATSAGVTGGTAETAVAVPETGGTITFSKQGTYGSNNNIYGLSYSGPDAQNTGWIQFIARNIEKFGAAGNSLGFYTGSWTPSGQGARNFSTMTAPVWFLDVLSNQAPFYEAISSSAPGTTPGSQGLSTISATQTAMYDAPAGRRDIVAPIFADTNVKSIKSRSLFDTYLVRGMQVLRHETITVEFAYVPPVSADPVPVTTHTGGGRVSALPADQYRALTSRFPGFAYLPHG